jgi:UTP--glucose-1-phosphate uridylyltransferase
MLPIVDRPAIQYVVEEAVAAGLKQLILVTAANKRAVEDHFDRELELERVLEAKGDEGRLREVRRLADIADIAFVRQKERLGIGHAVLTARSLVGDEPFALLFPDDVVFGEPPAIAQLIGVYERYGGSIVAVERLPAEEVVHYGIIQQRPLEDRIYEAVNIIEKPSLADAPSDLGIVGRYVLAPAVFEALHDTPPSANGEIQLTDGLSLLLQRGEKLYACELQGERFDIGRPIGLLKASLAETLRRADLAPELRHYLEQGLT